MPHAELKYSDNLDIDAARFLAEVESIIADHDAGAGACKGRAYPAAQFHHTHVILTVSLLQKPHRDDAWGKALMSKLENALRARLSQPCHISLGIGFIDANYVTYAPE